MIPPWPRPQRISPYIHFSSSRFIFLTKGIIWSHLCSGIHQSTFLHMFTQRQDAGHDGNRTERWAMVSWITYPCSPITVCPGTPSDSLRSTCLRLLRGARIIGVAHHTQLLSLFWRTQNLALWSSSAWTIWRSRVRWALGFSSSELLFGVHILMLPLRETSSRKSLLS